MIITKKIYVSWIYSSESLGRGGEASCTCIASKPAIDSQHIDGRFKIDYQEPVYLMVDLKSILRSTLYQNPLEGSKDEGSPRLTIFFYNLRF